MQKEAFDEQNEDYKHGKIAYEAYYKARSLPQKKFSDIDAMLKYSWIAAAQAVIAHFVGDADLYRPDDAGD